MKDTDHGEDKQKTGERADLVPVGAHEENDAAGEQDGSQDEGDEALPAQASGLVLVGLKGADAGGYVGVDDSGGLPAD